MSITTGSRKFFECRNDELQSICRIQGKAEKVASDIEDEDLTFKGLIILIGKAFREFIEYFSEGRYQGKLEKRITVLKDKNFDQYEQRIDHFQKEFIENLMVKAFEGFKAELSHFYSIAEQLRQEEQLEQAHPELCKELNTACDRKTNVYEAFKAFNKLPNILNAIVIDNPQSPLEQYILQLKAEFIKDSATESYLSKNLAALRIGLDTKKNHANGASLTRFLQPQDADLALLLPDLYAWKAEMLKQRSNFLEALPTPCDDLVYYSFNSEQISRVKKIVKLQNKEINSTKKLRASLVNFCADRIAEKITKDQKTAEKSKKDLFDKFLARREFLATEKVKAEAKLQSANDKNKIEKAKDIQERIDTIQSAEAFNEECLTILNECFKSWLEPEMTRLNEHKEALNGLTSQKNSELEDFANLHRIVFKYPAQTQNTIDAMLAEAAYRVFDKEVENHTDPKPASQDNSPEEIKDKEIRAHKFLKAIELLKQNHFVPLRKLAIGSHQDPEWQRRADDLTKGILDKLKILSESYQKIVDQCRDLLDPAVQLALRLSSDDEVPTAEQLLADGDFLKSLKAQGFTHQGMPKDGSCFFHSCAAGLKALSGPQYETPELEALKAMDGVALRKALYQHIRSKPEAFREEFALNFGAVVCDFAMADPTVAQGFDVAIALTKFAPDMQNRCMGIRNTFWNQGTSQETRNNFETSITDLFKAEFVDSLPLGSYLDEYAEAMANSPTTYVDNFELVAFTKFAGVNLVVHSVDYREGAMKIALEAGEGHETIHLYRPGAEQHYDYLIPPKKLS